MPQFKIGQDNEQVENQEQEPLKAEDCFPAQTLDQIRQEMQERFPGTTIEELEAMGC